MSKKLTFLFLFVSSLLYSQTETFVLTNNYLSDNKSVSDQFSYYSTNVDSLTIFDVLLKSDILGKKKKISNEIENLDFTTANYWINFSILNNTDKNIELVFQTARPITNEVTLYNISDINHIKEQFSGDALPFWKKSIQHKNSVFNINIKRNEKQTYWLKLKSDGEIISLPMIFISKAKFDAQTNRNQFKSGIFYGIFIFVVLIYFVFYILLNDVSFLLYVAYVFFSGLMHFSLDGYAHQYLFKSGGYLTQHIVLFSAGLTAGLVILYAKNYLKLKSSFKRVNAYLTTLLILIFSATLLSLFPNKLYEISYPIINGLSLIGTVSILFAAIYVRKKTGNVSWLFVSGMCILIISAVIFILGNFSIINVPSVTQISLKVGTLLEIILLAILMAGKYKSLQEEKEKAQKQLLIELERINEKLELQVKARTQEIEAKNEELFEINENILDSIKYAKRIQNAILPSEEKIKQLLPHSFIYFKPRDIVSGDFYWIEQFELNSDEMVVYATADCTGHGVPGAFVSIVGNCFLSLANQLEEIEKPGEILDFLNTKIKETFNAKYSKERINDGMDIALCIINKTKNELHFSGAKNAVIIVRGNKIKVIKGDRSAIGYSYEKEPSKFISTTYALEKGDMIYTFSDGYADQFGGKNGKKFKYSNLRKLFLEISKMPVQKQEEKIEETFLNWKGDLEQLDDILIIGVRY